MKKADLYRVFYSYVPKRMLEEGYPNWSRDSVDIVASSMRNAQLALEKGVVSSIKLTVNRIESLGTVYIGSLAKRRQRRR